MNTKYFLFLFVVSLLTVIVTHHISRLFYSSPESVTSLIAIVDAGSSGSRLVVYNSSKTDIFQLCHSSVEPGLNSLISEKDQLWLSFNSLLSNSADCIRLHYPNVTDVPLYVYGTGGMRKLSDKEMVPLYTTLVQGVSHSPLPFSLSFYNISVLSGEEEAQFGWYSVNHISNMIDISLTGNFKDSYGSLDLGGESLEIAFYYDLRKKLYTSSYGFLGANQMKNLIIKHLVIGLKAATVVNPCYPAGYSETAYGNTIMGSGNFDECSSLVNSLFHSSDLCKREGNFACQFVKRGITQQNTTFYGMSLLFYLADYVMFLDKGESADGLFYEPTSFHESLVRVSQMDWETLQTTIGTRHLYTSMSLLPYRMLQCIWMEFILDGIQKPNTANSNHVVFAKNIQNKHLDWTLGAALYINQSL